MPLATRLGITAEVMFDRLKENYDGYHFSWPSPDVFNPFSLLKAMALGEIGSYWFESGTPTYIIEMLRKYAVLPSEIGGEEASPSDFNVPLELATNYMPLLYQAGYLTIKGADLEFDAYMLDIPNKEVRVGLMKSLIPSYVTSDSHEVNSVVRNLARNIVRGDMDEALKLLQAFLSTVPYCDNTDYEGHYQQMLYVIFSLLYLLYLWDVWAFLLCRCLLPSLRQGGKRCPGALLHVGCGVRWRIPVRHVRADTWETPGTGGEKTHVLLRRNPLRWRMTIVRIQDKWEQCPLLPFRLLR